MTVGFGMTSNYSPVEKWLLLRAVANSDHAQLLGSLGGVAGPGGQGPVTIGAGQGKWFHPSPSSTIAVTIDPPSSGYVVGAATGNWQIGASQFATYAQKTAEQLGALTWTGHDIRSFDWAETNPALADQAGTANFIIGVALGIVGSVVVTGAGWLLKRYFGLEAPRAAARGS
jgi:hypothetical protein